jgi:hypothetical protein
MVEFQHWRSIGAMRERNDTFTSAPRNRSGRARVAALLVAMTVAPGWIGATPAADPFDPPGLGRGGGEEMRALLQVTFLRIEVLMLTVRVPPATGAHLRALSRDRPYSEALADSVAAVILSAEELWARQVMHRNVGHDRMLRGMREAVEKAADAGYVTHRYARRFAADLPELFGFLRDGGARKGDAIYFWSRGDTLRTVYRAADGTIRLDRSTVDPQARRAGVPSFFAPGTRFRVRLVESLLE